ncbi:MBL fold metallo-hydrolase [Amphritea opalescens]|uniref:MBL fold metallo-hydrolase n=1 Tax=Amphritea opalescens TaxID=2490544 RepID=UPI001F496D9F|nr:MBL fold metallo-hydrolase [Amphritea opalescens]
MKTTHTDIGLRILGVAGGAGHIYHGRCSSSFLILKDDHPICLIDLGLGVTCRLKDYGYTLPDTLVITHNHTDHAGELPVVLRVESAQQRQLNIVAAAPVAERLKRYRMAEHAELFQPEELANWIAPAPETTTPLVDDLDITFHAAQHSELCFGFVISREGIPLIGYTADSGCFAPLYEALADCRVAIYDARPAGSRWHAGLDEVAPYLNDQAYIIGHDLDEQNIPDDSRLLRPGQYIHLAEDH